MTHIDHSSQARPGIEPFPDRLYVVTAISNPARYRSRYQLYRAFAKHVADSGGILYTVECAFGGRPFEVTESGNPQHIQVRSDQELWFKENLLNIGISRLPANARYIATVDADFTFARPDWCQETIHQLQHHALVQMFSSVTYLDPHGDVVVSRTGFAERWSRGIELPTQRGPVKKTVAFHPKKAVENYGRASAEWGPPGGAWAYRRDALDQVGGLIDVCILGSGDWFMAAGAAGFMEKAIPAQYSPGFRSALLAWQKRAAGAFRENLGVVPGTVLHSWHGKMSDRNYGEREKILKSSEFDPGRDLTRDTQGLWRLHDDGSKRFANLRDDVRSYFRIRNEDSIDA